MDLTCKDCEQNPYDVQNPYNPFFTAYFILMKKTFYYYNTNFQPSNNEVFISDANTSQVHNIAVHIKVDIK